MDAQEQKPEATPADVPPIAEADVLGDPEREPSGWNRRNWFIDQFLHPWEKQE